MLSYVPKHNKNALLLSTQHDQPDISQRADRKPVVILAYNEGKAGGVDVVDKMIDTYRSKVYTLRWPMVVFYTVVDIAALNAFVIWLARLHKKPNWMA
jgi:Transposase IS4